MSREGVRDTEDSDTEFEDFEDDDDESHDTSLNEDENLRRFVNELRQHERQLQNYGQALRQRQTFGSLVPSVYTQRPSSPPIPRRSGFISNLRSRGQLSHLESPFSPTEPWFRSPVQQRSVPTATVTSASASSGGRVTPPSDIPMIRNYRNPETGYPDFERMKEDVNRERLEMTPSALAKRTRAFRIELSKYTATNQDRMAKVLSGNRNLFLSKDNRYTVRRDLKDLNPSFTWQPIEPSDPSDPQLNDPRFRQKIKEMKTEKWGSSIMPRGKLGTEDLPQFNRGPVNKEQMAGLTIPGLKRDNPQRWTPRQEQFAHRLLSIEPDDRWRYYQIQTDYNPDLHMNEAASRRMVPRPTIGRLRSRNDKQTKQMLRQSWQNSPLPRETRRSEAARRAILPSAINEFEDTQAMPPISESHSDPYTYTPSPADPDSNLIPTTRTELGKRARAAAMARKTSEKKKTDEGDKEKGGEKGTKGQRRRDDDQDMVDVCSIL